jgi:non-specific serine/threonine protein kinase
LRTALQFSLDHAPVTALELVTAIRPFWVVRGMFSEAQQWLDRAATAQCPQRRELRALAAAGSAAVAVMRGDLPTAHTRISAAREHLSGLTDPDVSGYIDSIDGLTAVFGGQLQRSRQYLRRALRITDDLEVQASAALFMGWFYELSGDLDGAANWHEQVLAVTTPHGESFWRSKALWSLGMDCLHRGEHPRAKLLIQQAVQLSTELNDPLNVAVCLETLGWLAVFDDNARHGTILMGAASALSESIGAWLPPAVFEQSHRDCEQRAREGLGTTGFGAAWAKGKELTMAQAVEVALAPVHGDTLAEQVDISHGPP